MAKHRNAKLIIELSAKNMSRREIARTRHISTHTRKEVLDRASETGVGWGDVSLLGDDEIAAMLDRPPSTVRNQLRDARAKLKLTLGGEGA